MRGYVKKFAQWEIAVRVTKNIGHKMVTNYQRLPDIGSDILILITADLSMVRHSQQTLGTA